MNRKLAKRILLLCAFTLLMNAEPALCWSNGGYSADPANPDYGTHDWIAQHALDYLPAEEKQYITDNLAAYLLGTELPDNSDNAIGGIGDTTKHHVYYSADGALVDDAAAQRANATYNQALDYLENKDYADAARTAGTMAHYVADVAVFGHDMGPQRLGAQKPITATTKPTLTQEPTSTQTPSTATYPTTAAYPRSPRIMPP